MPPPKKVDLLPAELKQWLKDALQSRGFGDIIDVTEELNFKLEEAELELRIGKTAVGKFSKVLQDQQDAFDFAQVVMKDLDIEGEGEMHKALMQMIAVHAVKLMRSASDKDEELQASELMNLGKMLNELMRSAGIREKLASDERDRIAKKVRAEAAEAASQAVTEAGLSGETVELVKSKILGIAS